MHSLSPRHATRLALRAVLRAHASATRASTLATMIHRAVLDGGPSASAIGRVLELVGFLDGRQSNTGSGQSGFGDDSSGCDGHRQSCSSSGSACAPPCTLQVMSVLVISGCVSREALGVWRAAGLLPGGALDEARTQLRPLLEWAHDDGDAESEAARPAAETSNVETSQGRVAMDEAAAIASCASGVPSSVLQASEVRLDGVQEASPALAEGAAARSLCSPMRVVECEWDAASLSVALNVTLGRANDAVVVLDNLVSGAQRAGLLSLLCGRGDVSTEGAVATGQPPSSLWERSTVDAAGLPPSWGLRPSELQKLGTSPPSAVIEVQSRLAKLYPEYTIAHMPQFDEDGSGRNRRTNFVANAAVFGNAFQWQCGSECSNAAAPCLVASSSSSFPLPSPTACIQPLSTSTQERHRLPNRGAMHTSSSCACCATCCVWRSQC